MESRLKEIGQELRQLSEERKPLMESLRKIERRIERLIKEKEETVKSITKIRLIREGRSEIKREKKGSEINVASLSEEDARALLELLKKKT